MGEKLLGTVMVQVVSGVLDQYPPDCGEVRHATILLRVGGPAPRAVHQQHRAGDRPPQSLGSGEATSEGPEARTLGSYFHCQRPRSLMRMPCSHTWLASSGLSSGSCSRRRATASAMEA